MCVLLCFSSPEIIALYLLLLCSECKHTVGVKSFRGFQVS